MHGEIPGSFGRYGCVISHIFAGSFLEAVEDIYEGTVIPNQKFLSEIQLFEGTKRIPLDLNHFGVHNCIVFLADQGSYYITDLFRTFSL